MSILPPLGPVGGSGGPLICKGWDLARVGGVPLPGKWKITEGKLILKMDKHRRPGVDGSNPVFHGIDPQPFSMEGEQWTDAQREDLVQKLSTLLPQPGASQNQQPLLLDHPSVKHLPFAVMLHILGCGILEVIGPFQTKLKIFGYHWLQPKAGTVATVSPTKGTRSKITDDKDKQNPPNPKPTDQPGICGPPSNFSPGQ